LQSVADEYDFLEDDIGRIWSIGGTSAEWMAAMFDERYSQEIEETAYIASNGHAKLVMRKTCGRTIPTRTVPRSSG
jgi:hypothetical protein